MNVVSIMDNEVQILEMVSEAENPESEHEEGEISEDDDVDDFAPERRLLKKGSPVTSEVVIYDDHGRTAIFTSPKKKKKKNVREHSSYPRAPDGARRWSRDESSKWWEEKDEGSGMVQKEIDLGRRRQSETAEPSVKKKKKSKLKAGKKLREDVIELENDASEDYQVHKKVTHDPPHRHRSPSSTNDSETLSSSGDDDEDDDYHDDSSSKPLRSRGKENKRSHTLSKSHTRSPPHFGTTKPTSQSSSSKQQPAPVHKSHSEKSSSKHVLPQKSTPAKKKNLYRKSPLSHSCYKSSKDLKKRKTSSLQSQYRSQVKPSKTSVKRSHKIDDLTSMLKLNQPSKGKTHDIALMKGQKQPPPGSLGEMLLKKTMKGKLKVRPEAGESGGLKVIKENVDTKSMEENKGVSVPVEDVSPEIVVQECYTLDQEDEDELQLRLIALQSSLKVLSGVRKEGQLEMMASGSSLTEKSSLLQENIQGRGEGFDQECISLLQSSGDKFPFSSTLDNSAQQQKWNESSQNVTEILDYLNKIQNAEKRNFGSEDNSLGDVEVSLDDSSQSSVRSLTTTSEIVMEFIDTNKSYMDVQESNGHLIGNTEELQNEVKELSDCNQDPVDMDICDSSPGEEEDEDTLDEEIIQKVKERVCYSVGSPMDTGTAAIKDFLNSCSNDIKENTSRGSEMPPQIPVEWAYMMPPPPPPDQPANDLSNINNWCYDQNMYLQTMQAQYESNNSQYSHYALQETSSVDWTGGQQSQSPQWNCSVNEDHHTDLTVSEGVAPPLPSTSQEFDTNDITKVESFGVTSDVSETQRDLKDLPAEQYQAFMSVVLKQQTAQPKRTTTNDVLQRNLIEVPLIKDVGNCLNHLGDTRHLTAVKQASAHQGNNILVTKRSEAKRRKRIKTKIKKKLIKKTKNKAAVARELKQVTEEVNNKQKVVKQTKKAAVARELRSVTKEVNNEQMVESVPEDDDEDLLRAILLIDMTRKKQQKEVVSSVEQVPITAEASKFTGIQKNVDKQFAGGVKKKGGSSRLHSLPLSSDSSPVAKIHSNRTALLKKVHKQPSRVKEGSPTHKFMVDMRPRLSDIGGFGLDPKSSRYDYPIPLDHPTHNDAPKFKFPLVKPVIINLNSDSEDETEESKVMNHPSSQGPKKEAVPEATTSGTFSSSIDLLLKSMRNAKPFVEDGKDIQEKPGPSSKSSPSNPLLKRSTVAHKDSTSNVVRHLSRTQQEEYRWLKEQLRQKELLHKRRQLQQQKPPNARRTISVVSGINQSTFIGAENAGESIRSPSSGVANASHGFSKFSESPPKSDVGALSAASGSGGLTCSREVCLKEMGRLQIQLSNVATCNDSSLKAKIDDSGEKRKDEQQCELKDAAETGESFQQMSMTEDEDEATLRMMVLQTLQQKKLSGRKTSHDDFPQNVVTPSDKYVAEESPSDSTLKLVIRQEIDDNTASKAIEERENPPPRLQSNRRKVIIEDDVDETKNTGKHRCNNHEEQQLDEEMVGEWMVLDEVIGEENEGNVGGHSSDKENEQSLKLDSATNKPENDKGDKIKNVLDCSLTTENLGCTSVRTRAGKASYKSGDYEQNLEENRVDDKVSVQFGDQSAEAFHQGNDDLAEEFVRMKDNCVTKMQRENIKLNGQTVDMEETLCSGGKSNVIVPPSNSSIEKEETQRQDGIKLSDEEGKDSSLTEESTMRNVKCSMSDEQCSVHSEDDVQGTKPAVSIFTESKTCKDSEPVNGKEKDQSLAKSGQHLLLVPPLEKPQLLVSEILSKQGQEEAMNTKDSKMNPNSEEIRDIIQKASQSEQGLVRDKIDVQESIPKKFMTKPKEQEKGLTGEALSTSLTRATKINVLQRTEPNIKAEINALVKMVQGKQCNQVNNSKPAKTKRLLLLKRFEREYIEKRLGLNKVITQLGPLVEEVTVEEQQRQSLRKTMMQMRAQLKAMEMQHETKSNALKTKMAHIRELQTQLTSDRQAISELKHKAELLGRQEVGISYILPKVQDSPHSKTKDKFKKKLLASNIDALRQQMREVSNRSRGRLQVAFHNADNQGTIGRGKTPQADGENVGKGFNLRQETGPWNQPLGSHVIATKGNVKTAVKNLFQVRINEDKLIPSVSKGISSKTTSKGPLVDVASLRNKNNLKHKLDPSSDWEVTKAAKIQDGGDNNNIFQQRTPESDSTTAVGQRQQNEQAASKVKTACEIEDGEKLDEMNELCPYDLLGRCNDDSCTYQHFAQPRNGSRSMMKPAASLTAKAGEQNLRSGPETGVEADAGGTGSGPNTRTVRMGPDTGMDRAAPDTGTDRTEPDTGMNRMGLGTGMGRTELDSGLDRLGPDTGLVRTAPNTGTYGMETDTGTNGTDRTGPNTGMEEMEAVTAEETPDPNLLPADINNSGSGGPVGDKFIPLDFRIEDKCALSKDDGMKSSVIQNSYASTCSTLLNIVHTTIDKNEALTMSGVVNIHKTEKRPRASKEDGPLNNVDKSISSEKTGDGINCKRTRLSSREHTTTSMCGTASPIVGEEFGVISSCHNFSQEYKIVTHDLNSKALICIDKHIESMIGFIDKISEVSTINKLNMETSADEDKAGQHMKTEDVYVGQMTDDVGSKCIELGGITATAGIETVLQGQVQQDDSQEMISQESHKQDRKGQENSSGGTLTHYHNLNQKTLTLEKPLHELNQDHQLQSDEAHSEEILTKVSEENESKITNASVQKDTMINCAAEDATRTGRPNTRKKSQVVDSVALGEAVSTRCRKPKVSRRENRRGRSKTVAMKLPKVGPNECVENSGANRCGLKRKATQKKKNNRRGSANRGRKK
ncbi:uncharacterized protein LOC121866389 isoform X2 [Homarus americanus]|uniref:uncharacterized protein LOC121866389 isoform X2 n=1 Tax=Homarus americanus TaxID=6706 RepID=UPI001C447783|nr:uncharacterized protein LOC121866389 isoform X2 [Homarus americanus]